MTTELREDQLVHDTILYLPVDVIDPDPAQPRLAVDAELADSIAQHGVLQAIEVRPHPESADRWMITDGERRWRGAVAAKLATIKCTIALDVEDAADRLVRQIVRNEGKPLTPVEEAKAFKRIIDERRAGGDKTYGVVQLAKELGIAKSTVSDRLGMIDIPAFWLEYIVKGPLQASHAPILRRWRLVPEKYQREALQAMKEDMDWPEKGERIGVSAFEQIVRSHMAKYVKPLSEVRGYDGPTEKGNYEQYVWGSNRNLAKVYAMDPDLWRPLVKEEAKKKSAATRTQNEKKKKITTPRWVKAAIAGGAKLEKGYFSEYGNKSGGTKIGEQRGTGPLEWSFGYGYREQMFDPAALIAKQDLAKLVIYFQESNYSPAQYTLVTKDNGALGAARKTYLEARTVALREILVDVGQEILAAGQRAGREQLVMGGAAPHVIAAFLAVDKDVADELHSLAIATDCPGARDVAEKEGAAATYLQTLEREPAETLLNAIAITTRDKIKTPVARLEAWEKRQTAAYAKVKPTFAAATAENAGDEVEDDAPDPAAKKPTPRRRKNAVDEEALNAEATGDDLDDEGTAVDGLEVECMYCGCSESNACETDEGPCSWIPGDRPVCNAPDCVEKFRTEFPTEAADLGLLEPAHAGAED